MGTIRDLFLKPVDRKIEEVIKVDQDDVSTVRDELDEYVFTESIGMHFKTILDEIAKAAVNPHEGIGVWVSGFFGSGKSSFAKILGYTVAARDLGGQTASAIFKTKAEHELPKNLAGSLTALVDVVNLKIKTFAIIFDVSMDRGVRTASERITEIMYKALLRALDYSEDFDLAELEISLENDGLLDQFRSEFLRLHKKPWDERRKLGRAVNEASAVLHQLDSQTYPSADSWAKSLAQGRADITPNLLAERAFTLASKRKPNHALIFIIDEVGQYVSRSVEKMLDLQAVIQAFGREGKNRVKRKDAPAPCWIVVTAQEKLNEVVDALDSKRTELARLQDRFPQTIDLKQSDIAFVTSKRVLDKKPQAKEELGRLYDEHEGRLKNLCSLERTGRACSISKDEFIALYPYLPYQIDLSIDIVAGLRLRRGAQRHIGGSNRTIIKQAQQMLVNPRTNLASRQVKDLVTLDLVYELLEVGGLLPNEVTREVDDVPKRLPGDEIVHRVAKAIALLEVVADLPRTPKNLSAVLHPRLDAESIQPDVDKALKRLEQAQIIKDSDEGYKLLTLEERNWDTTRRGIEAKPIDRNKIKREIFKEIFDDPSIKQHRFENRRSFSFALSIDGDTVDANGDIPLHLFIADSSNDFSARCEEARKASTEKAHDLFWVVAFTEEIHRDLEELHRSREMVQTYGRLADQSKLRSEESTCLGEEKIRKDRLHRSLRTKLMEIVAVGTGYFEAVRKDASAIGNGAKDVLGKLRDEVIPRIYPKFHLGNRQLKGDEAEKILTEVNLKALSTIFFEEGDGLNLVVKQDEKLIPNLNAEICREVLQYLQREHSYGTKVTGKGLDTHFEGIGYAWDRQVLRLVLAVLLRGGAIEVTHQGRKYRNHNEPACKQAFLSNNAFRAASFAPRESIDLRMLGDAARRYEELTGNEIDVEESSIAQGFKKIAEADKRIVFTVLERVRTNELPGLQFIREFQETVDGVVEMPTDDCVKTLAGEGASYKENRAKVLRISESLTGENLKLIAGARNVVEDQVPCLLQDYATLSNDSESDLLESAEALRSALQSEYFFEHFKDIRRLTDSIRSKYVGLYSGLHAQKYEAYEKAIDEIKGLPEWTAVSALAKHVNESTPSISKEHERQVSLIIEPLERKLCPHEDLPENSDVCSKCRATVSQLDTEMAALETLKAKAVRQLQELAVPEKKIMRVRISSIIGNVVESREDVENVVERLRDHLLKLLAEDARVVLE